MASTESTTIVAPAAGGVGVVGGARGGGRDGGDRRPPAGGERRLDPLLAAAARRPHAKVVASRRDVDVEAQRHRVVATHVVPVDDEPCGRRLGHVHLEHERGRRGGTVEGGQRHAVTADADRRRVAAGRGAGRDEDGHREGAGASGGHWRNLLRPFVERVVK